MFAKILSTWPALDILVNNAGLQRDAPLTEMTLAQWNRVLGVNLTGMFLCSRAAARAMVRQGVRPGVSRADGKIICMSSVHEVIPWAGHVNYAASKGGVMLMMKSIAQESMSGLSGGNSNWRGPIWMPVNYLLIESLQKFHHYYGDEFKVECPTGSGQFKTINEIADELSRRLAKLFLKGEDGQRPVLKYHPKLATDPHFKDYVLFHEYFHGDNGRGVGASHQTGWTGLVAKLLQPRNKAAKQTTAPKRAKAVAKPRSQEPALVAV